MHNRRIVSIAVLTFMIFSSGACGNARATGSYYNGASSAPDLEGESVEERRYVRALNNLKEKHDLELRELRERHRLELERKDFEIERLTADHQRELAALKDRHELEIKDLTQTHAREVSELN